eukprot:TRINITY_DN775_c0_g1_i12.p1 TRINITY_DN775_c0_g1~~TRINITY_DN775_c0_g1_i12.p1  ORF type:complete len:159 (+),score=10.78 TRINITY_DN775_c0_g1_i12:424-900(+)
MAKGYGFVVRVCTEGFGTWHNCCVAALLLAERSTECSIGLLVILAMLLLLEGQWDSSSEESRLPLPGLYRYVLRILELVTTKGSRVFWLAVDMFSLPLSQSPNTLLLFALKLFMAFMELSSSSSHLEDSSFSSSSLSMRLSRSYSRFAFWFACDATSS